MTNRIHWGRLSGRVDHTQSVTLRVLNRRSLITTMSSPNQLADKALQGQAVASEMQ